jgi:hypothetical protein
MELVSVENRVVLGRVITLEYRVQVGHLQVAFLAAEALRREPS